MLKGAIYLITLLSVLSLFCCTNNAVKEDEVVETEIDEYPLAGKWQLTERKFDPDTTFRVVAPDETYVKIITKKSFVWYSFQENGSRLIGIGGGTYRLEGESYIEDIEFTYPPGSGILGTSIPFKCTLEGNTWLHSGYIQEREMDDEVGDFVVTATRRLEEIWTRVE